MPLSFEWDEQKARSNLAKHRVTFAEASTVFADNLSVTISDPIHSEREDRFIIVGYSQRQRLLVVVHKNRGDNIRIISAPLASRRERQNYEHGT